MSHAFSILKHFKFKLKVTDRELDLLDPLMCQLENNQL